MAEPAAEEPGIAPLSLSKPVTVRLHYRRSDNNYTGWGVWAWEDGKQGTRYEFKNEEGVAGVVATIPVRAGLTRINYFVYKIDGSDWIKDVTNNGNGDQIMDLTDRADTYDVYVQSGEWGFSTEEPSDVTVRIHYSRPKEDYAGWYVWYWEQGRAAEHGGPSGLVGGASVPFDPKGGEAVAEIQVNQGVSQLGYIIYKNELDEKNKDIKLDQFINVSGLTGTYNVYVTSGQEGYVPGVTVSLHNGDEVTTKTVLEGESFTPETPEDTENARFLGWATEVNGAAAYGLGDAITVEGDMDLYAVWETIARETYKYYIEIQDLPKELLPSEASFSFNVHKKPAGSGEDAYQFVENVSKTFGSGEIKETYKYMGTAFRLYWDYVAEPGYTYKLTDFSWSGFESIKTEEKDYTPGIIGFISENTLLKDELDIGKIPYKENPRYSITVRYVDWETNPHYEEIAESVVLTGFHAGDKYDVSEYFEDTIEANGHHYIYYPDKSSNLTGSIPQPNPITLCYVIDDNNSNYADMYEVDVFYKVKNGTWNDGTAEDVHQIYRITVKDGRNYKNVTATVTPPAVGLSPNEGYTAGHWDIQPPETVTFRDKKTDNVYTYTYEEGFTVTYYDGDEVFQSQPVKNGRTTAPDIPEKENYIFLGWATEAGGEVKYKPGEEISVSGDMNLYAVWHEAAVLTFYMDVYNLDEAGIATLRSQMSLSGEIMNRDNSNYGRSLGNVTLAGSAAALSEVGDGVYRLTWNVTVDGTELKDIAQNGDTGPNASYTVQLYYKGGFTDINPVGEYKLSTWDSVAPGKNNPSMTSTSASSAAANDGEGNPVPAYMGRLVYMPQDAVTHKLTVRFVRDTDDYELYNSAIASYSYKQNHAAGAPYDVTGWKFATIKNNRTGNVNYAFDAQETGEAAIAALTGIMPDEDLTITLVYSEDRYRPDGTSPGYSDNIPDKYQTYDQDVYVDFFYADQSDLERMSYTRSFTLGGATFTLNWNEHGSTEIVDKDGYGEGVFAQPDKLRVHWTVTLPLAEKANVSNKPIPGAAAAISADGYQIFGGNAAGVPTTNAFYNSDSYCVDSYTFYALIMYQTNLAGAGNFDPTYFQYLTPHESRYSGAAGYLPKEVTVTENTGYQFLHWEDAEGNVVSETASFTPTLNVQGGRHVNATYTAVFKEALDTVQVEYYYNGVKGYAPAGKPTELEGRVGTTVTLTPDETLRLTYGKGTSYAENYYELDREAGGAYEAVVQEGGSAVIRVYYKNVMVTGTGRLNIVGLPLELLPKDAKLTFTEKWKEVKPTKTGGTTSSSKSESVTYTFGQLLEMNCIEYDENGYHFNVPITVAKGGYVAKSPSVSGYDTVYEYKVVMTTHPSSDSNKINEDGYSIGMLYSIQYADMGEHTVTIHYLDKLTGETLQPDFVSESIHGDHTYDFSDKIPESITGEDGTVYSLFVANLGGSSNLSKAAGTMADKDIEITAYYSPDKNGDNVPDAAQVFLTFHVVNGAWNDTTREDIHKAVDVYSYNEGKERWENKSVSREAQLPEVGGQPDLGFLSGYIQENWGIHGRASLTYRDAGKNIEFTYTYQEDPNFIPTASVTVADTVYGESYEPETTTPTGPHGDEYTAAVIYYTVDKNGEKGEALNGAPVDAGSYFVEAVWTAEGRPEVTAEAAFKIAKRPILLYTDNSDSHYTYDGEEHTVAATAENLQDYEHDPINGAGAYMLLVNGDKLVYVSDDTMKLTLTNYAVGHYQAIDGAIGKTEYVKIVNEAGKDVTANYTGRIAVRLWIDQAHITIKADDKAAAYGGEIPELTATITGKPVNGDEVNVTLTREEGTDVGRYTITPSAEDLSLNYTVTYVEGTLTIDPVVDVTVTNGSFAAESNGYGAYSGTEGRVGVATGEDQTITFTAAEGMALESVTVDGEEAALAADGSYTFEDVTEPHSIEVLFSADSDGDGTPDAAETNDITVTVTGGTADPAESPITVAFGEDQTITFTANAGMELESVTVDGQPAELAEDGSYTFENVTEPHSIAVAYAAEGGDEPAGPDDPAGPGGDEPGGDQPGGGQPGGGQPGGGQPGGGQPGDGQPGGGAGADGGAGAGDDAGNADDAGGADADGGAAVIDEDDTPLADTPTLPEGQNEAPAEIQEDETPLADGPSGEGCCILHLLIMLGAFAVGVYYTHDRKKRQEEAFETSARLL